MGRPFCRIRTLFNAYFPGCTAVSIPNGISIVSASFAWLTTPIVTDKQTNRPRYSICNDRPIYVCSTAMRPNNNNWNKCSK